MSTLSRLRDTTLNFTSDGSSTNALITASASTIDFEGVGGADVSLTGVDTLLASGTITSEISLILQDPGAGTNTTTIQSLDPLSSSYTLTLPPDSGSSGQILSTDGSGILDWITPGSTGAGSPDTSVQYNNAGAFNGSANFTWANGSQVLAINGTISNALGLVTTPSYTFTGDLTTGMWSSGSGVINLSNSGVESARLTSTGLLSIGSSSPDSNSRRMYVLYDFDDGDTTGTRRNVHIDTNINETTNTATEYYGLYSDLSIANTSTADYTTDLVSCYLTGTYQSTGTVSEYSGSSIRIGNNNVGTITELFGSKVVLTNGSTGTTTDSYGLYVGTAFGATSTNTNVYGLYINSLSGASVGSPFGIYQNGSLDINFFNGVVSLGDSTPNTTAKNLYIRHTFDDQDTGSSRAQFIDCNINEPLNSTANIIGFQSNMEVNGANTVDYQTILGTTAGCNHTGSGTVTELVVSKCLARNSGAGDVTNLMSHQISFRNSGSGNVANAYCINIETPSYGSGTNTNVYGVRIAALNNAAVTNAYGINQVGASDINYFAGNTGIGTNDPQATLHTVIGLGSLPAFTNTLTGLFQNNSAISDNCMVHLISGTTGTCGLRMGDTDDEYTAGFSFDNSTLALTFDVNTSERLNMNSTRARFLYNADATSTGTGCIVTVGGIGTGGSIYCGGKVTTDQTDLNFTPALSTGVTTQIESVTATDNITAASGTATAVIVNRIAQSTIAATNATVTTTDAATLYIENAPAAGTNETITNPWALWVDAGDVRIDDNLTVTGSLTSSYTHTIVNTATYTILATDKFLGVTRTTTGACTITLPQISTVGQIIYYITDEGGNASVNNITINRAAADTISGNTSVTITQDFNSISLYNNGGTGWFIF